MTKPEKLAALLTRTIQSQHMVHGAKFMSLRELSTQFGVSVNTAQKALHILEDQGVLSAVAKKGYFIAIHHQANAAPPTAECLSRGRSGGVVDKMRTR